VKGRKKGSREGSGGNNRRIIKRRMERRVRR
jgi:hypothetical protein